MGLPAGARLGPYEVVGPLGAGGMGEVYRARDTRLARQVAVKILPDEVAQDPHRVSRFESEARALAALSHPNVLAIHDVGKTDGRFYAVTELLDGETLRGRLVGNRISFRKAAEIAASIADGLAAAHAAGIVHRDLKPENVFLTSDGRLKILDFGLATYAEPVSGDAVTLTSPPAGTLSGEVVGTLSYMAPEQLRGARVDGRADIFALGCVLYEMLSGRRPFSGPTPADTLAAILHRDPDPLSAAAPGIPPILDSVVSRCLEKRPEERYDTAHDLALSLRSASLSSEAAALRGPPLVPAGAGLGRKPLVAFAVLLASLVIVGVAILGSRAMRSRAPGPPWDVPRQITSSPGWDGEPALSPDGTLVAYSSNLSGAVDIWLVDIKGGEPLRLTRGGDESRRPAWFPNGRTVAFVRSLTGRRSVWKVARLGGSPVPVMDDADMPAISPDGQQIAFVRRESLGPRIWVARLDEPADAKRLTGDEDGLWDHMDPSWSPNGDTICYSDFRHLWLIPANGGRARQLTTGDVQDREPVWSASGDFVYFSSRRDDQYGICRVSVADGTVIRLTSGPGPERHPAISRDDRIVVYSSASSSQNVLVLDRLGGKMSRFESARANETPAMAPDGSGIAYVSNRLGKFDLWYQPLVAGGPSPEPARRLTDVSSAPAAPTFSPDGRWVAYFRVVDGQRDLWSIPVAGGEAVRLTDGNARSIHPAFSPDGSRLAFVSNRTGRDHIWIMPITGAAPSGPAWQVTEDSGEDENPAFSPDGSTIVFIRREDIWTVAARQGATSQRITTGGEVHYAAWEADGRSLLATGLWGGSELELRVVRTESGKSESLAPRVILGGRDAIGYFSRSRDGRYLAADYEQLKGNLWTVSSAVRRP